MQKIIVGIDEAGRGPLAGPVIACAITVLGNSKHEARNSKHVSDFEFRISDLKLRDSKLLTPNARSRFFNILTIHPEVEWGIGMVSEKMIDKLNIFQATRLAMRKAFLQLNTKLAKRGLLPHLVIIDGISTIDISAPQKAVIKADATIFQCMAASIIAKVTRDRLMLRLHKKYPVYGFNRHKGYGTKLHFAMLEKYGPCPIHRLSFAPCRAQLDYSQLS